MLTPDGMSGWSIHSVGVESGETPLQTLVAGAVIAFEPIFSVGADAYYLEDVIHITATGVDVLSAGLPYTALEIEAACASLGEWTIPLVRSRADGRSRPRLYLNSEALELTGNAVRAQDVQLPNRHETGSSLARRS